MKKKDRRKLYNRKRRIARRLRPRQWAVQDAPMFAGRNIQYEVAARARGVSAGGIGAVHVLARRVGLIQALNRSLKLFKRHQPYFESDHVLNLAYNIMASHTRLEDLELLRQNESYLDMLGAQRIPDPTTAGDFLRRFNPADIAALMDAVNDIRRKLWLRIPAAERRRAIIDADGTDVSTRGEKKDGIGLSYKGIWGYGPLLISLANFGEPLFLINRPANTASHTGAAVWLDRAITLCEGAFEEILLRGDTDFSLTANFDRWTARSVRFVFGFNAYPKLISMADALPEECFKPLARPAHYEVRTEERERRENVKDRIVREKEYKNIRLNSEQVAEFPYQPEKCDREYRMIVLRKNLSVDKGSACLMMYATSFISRTIRDRRQKKSCSRLTIDVTRRT